MCPRADKPREAGSWDRAEGWWVVSAEEPRVYEGIWRAKNRARQEGWEGPVLVTRAGVPLTK